jgi:hypothetical protein
MTPKLSMLLAACLVLLAFNAGCKTVGEATGKAVKTVEQGAEDFQKGYEKGRK